MGCFLYDTTTDHTCFKGRFVWKKTMTEVFDEPLLFINMAFSSLMTLTPHYNFFMVFQSHFSLIYFKSIHILILSGALLTLQCLVSTKRSHIFKQTWSSQLQVRLSLCGLSVDSRHYELKRYIIIPPQTYLEQFVSCCT